MSRKNKKDNPLFNPKPMEAKVWSLRDGQQNKTSPPVIIRQRAWETVPEGSSCKDATSEQSRTRKVTEYGTVRYKGSPTAAFKTHDTSTRPRDLQSEEQVKERHSQFTAGDYTKYNEGGGQEEKDQVESRAVVNCWWASREKVKQGLEFKFEHSSLWIHDTLNLLLQVRYLKFLGEVRGFLNIGIFLIIL